MLLRNELLLAALILVSAGLLLSSFVVSLPKQQAPVVLSLGERLGCKLLYHNPLSLLMLVCPDPANSQSALYCEILAIKSAGQINMPPVTFWLRDTSDTSFPDVGEPGFRILSRDYKNVDELERALWSRTEEVLEGSSFYLFFEDGWVSFKDLKAHPELIYSCVTNENLYVLVRNTITQELGDLESIVKGEIQNLDVSISKGFSTLRPVIEGFATVMREVSKRISTTRIASHINAEDLGDLRSSMRVVGPTPEGALSGLSVLESFQLSGRSVLDSMLGQPSDDVATSWDDCFEPQELVMYSTALKSLVSSRHLKWNNATGKTLRKTFHDCEFPVSAKNHLVLSMRRYHAMYELGAVLGVELKKKLTWQGLRQAEVEFYLWADSSLYPFIQLITDMQHGGLAFYCKGGSDIRLVTLESMDAIRIFVRQVGNGLPANLGENDGSTDQLVCPEYLQMPKRKHLRSRQEPLHAIGEKHATSPIRQQIPWLTNTNPVQSQPP